MTETDLKRDLCERLRPAFTLRFEDRFTAGIPDLLVGQDGHGLWVEVKLDDDLARPWRWRSFKLQQLVLGEQLGRATGVPVYVLCYSVRQRRCLLAPAGEVLHHARLKLPLPDLHCHDGKGTDQLHALLNR